MKFYSSGKLLITGEYLVLNGAEALAVPLNFGQSLEIVDIRPNKYLRWESFEKEKIWFECEIEPRHFEIRKASENTTADILIRIINAATRLNPNFKNKLAGKRIVTKTNFDLQYGFGSSSSLISNIAYWANVDHFVLHKMVSDGSGYDVITARQEEPVFFRLIKDSYSVENAGFNPLFKDQVYFIFLGNKQDTAKSVESYLSKRKSFKQESKIISELSKHIAHSKTLKDFEFYLREHNQVISSVLRVKPIKETRFKDLDGEIKSLGAWGGDFAMLTWNRTKKELEEYLISKKIKIFFSFDELVKAK